jgi:CheY-like chemotaxis protein
VVEALGGTITAKSERGRGATFRVTLPPVPGTMARRITEISGPASAGVRRKVLVVDDDALVARSLGRALKGHEVEAVASAEDALDRLDRETFDVVLCDLMMPTMTGMDLYEEVRVRWPGLEQRILFMTGGSFTARARDFTAHVKNTCLEKPVGPGELLEAVERAAGGVVGYSRAPADPEPLSDRDSAARPSP